MGYCNCSQVRELFLMLCPDLRFLFVDGCVAKPHNHQYKIYYNSYYLWFKLGGNPQSTSPCLAHSPGSRPVGGNFAGTFVGSTGTSVGVGVAVGVGVGSRTTNCTVVMLSRADVSFDDVTTTRL